MEVNMKKELRRADPLLWVLLLVSALLLPAPMYAGNDVMGEIQFEGKSNVEKTSGVWVDGEYVGYLKELKGSKKVLLLPGEHSISVRQDGYQDFTQRIVVQPGQTEVVRVAMEKAPTGPLPDVTATLKIAVNPSRAAVFLDGLFVGHVGEFEGLGRGMLVAPGTHQIKIALPGYQTFETDVNPLANQKVEIKTDLVKNGAPPTEPLVKTETSAATPPSVVREAVVPPQR
jgi:PEGA domain